MILIGLAIQLLGALFVVGLFCLAILRIPGRLKSNLSFSRSCAEVEYRSMTAIVCELKWLKQLFGDLGFNILNVCGCIVRVNLPYLLQIIRCFMNALSISKLIVTLFEMM